MPNIPPSSCRTHGCAGLAYSGGYCEECKKQRAAEPQQAKTHKKDEIDKLYMQVRWKNGTRPQLLRSNPVCQLLDHWGKQCNQLAVEVHHLVSPYDDITKMWDWRNLVALCRQHHHKHSGEDPNNPREYAPTKMTLLGVTEVQVHPKPDPTRDPGW